MKLEEKLYEMNCLLARIAKSLETMVEQKDKTLCKCKDKTYKPKTKENQR